MEKRSSRLNIFIINLKVLFVHFSFIYFSWYIIPLAGLSLTHRWHAIFWAYPPWDTSINPSDLQKMLRLSTLYKSWHKFFIFNEITSKYYTLNTHSLSTSDVMHLNSFVIPQTSDKKIRKTRRKNKTGRQSVLSYLFVSAKFSAG